MLLAFAWTFIKMDIIVVFFFPFKSSIEKKLQQVKPRSSVTSLPPPSGGSYLAHIVVNEDANKILSNEEDGPASVRYET